jgi:hypothetical protein|tara:strand:- start:1468 stop:1734 length:267 start_codon:yes stop_codon:yes gene_type:complete
MFTYHIIQTSSNKVVDTCIWDGDTNVWQPPDGHFCILAEDFVSIGWIYNSEGVGIGSTAGDTTHKWRPSDVFEPYVSDGKDYPQLNGA